MYRVIQIDELIEGDTKWVCEVPIQIDQLANHLAPTIISATITEKAIHNECAIGFSVLVVCDFEQIKWPFQKSEITRQSQQTEFALSAVEWSSLQIVPCEHTVKQRRRHKDGK